MPRLVLQVERGSLSAAKPAAGGGGEATTVAPELADALERAGLVSLRPLFQVESGEVGRVPVTNLLAYRIGTARRLVRGRSGPRS
jgi:hypothetical protein